MDSNSRSPLPADSGQRIVNDSSSLDSTAQTGNSEWQEEIYQKIKVLQDLYFAEIHVVYQKVCSKLQQHEFPPPRVTSGVLEKTKLFKQMLERILQFLQIPQSDIQHFHKYRLETLEKQILSILSPHRASQRSPALQQGEIPQPHLLSLQQNLQSHSQIHQSHSHESGVNSKLESINVEGSSVPTMQLSEMSGLHGSVSSFPGINFSQPNMMDSLQPCSNLDLGQGNAPISVQKAAMGSIQENPVRAPQQASANSSTPDIGANLFHLSSLDSTAQTGSSDLQEEIYQKIKVLRDLYFSEMHDIYQKMCAKLLQHDSLPQQTKSDEVEKLKFFKQMLERILQFLQIPRNRIQPFHKERLLTLEKAILSILSSHRPRKPCPPLQQRQIPQPHLQSLQQNKQSQSHKSINSSQPTMMDSFIEAPSERKRKREPDTAGYGKVTIPKKKLDTYMWILLHILLILIGKKRSIKS